ncbi:hypothetical protein B9Z65_6407 [Elsinoe australis]|uniref:Uncharacterized protein n=1 Tax=Elsinoe australis TaxID=40998 RepID=A0A2P8A8K1_9PEZI|nr:hypothetical protein B9Z65_6407 [Elsinoe australis]
MSDSEPESEKIEHDADDEPSTEIEASTEAPSEQPAAETLDAEGLPTTVDSKTFAAAIQAKLTRWGAFQKDWTQATDLHTWLRKLPEGDAQYLNKLRTMAEDPDTDIEELEELFPPSDVTNFWWTYKPAFEKLRGKKVLLVIGHCPQYLEHLNCHPEQIQPEQSESLTGTLISWVARASDLPVLAWDMRHDCRKAGLDPRITSAYLGCEKLAPLMTETRQCLTLSWILLMIASNCYDIEIGATLTFSVVANSFVDVIAAPHIKLNEHISKISRIPSLATVLTTGLADSGASSMAWRELHSSLSDELFRAPAEEHGRARVTLPSVELTTPVMPFDDLMAGLDDVRKKKTVKYNKTRQAKDKQRRKQDKEFDEVVKARGRRGQASKKKRRLEDPQFDEKVKAQNRAKALRWSNNNKDKIKEKNARRFRK